MSKRVVKKSDVLAELFGKRSIPKEKAYPAFEEIDGRHPWQQAVPEGYILYPVRELKQGRVAYFNFHLAKEIGLIDESHPHRLTPALTQTVLKTFSIQILNEYDQLHRRHLLNRHIKPNKYMSTRYLQLQHPNKQGKTSGDGRGVWNGSLRRKDQTWDISSRGTGVTSLSPGAVEAKVPLKTGAGTVGYGCGMADIDELMSSALMSEIFHLRGIPTERVLAVIDLGKGLGIGVRASPNLIRPAHLFLWVKQNKIEPLRRGVDFFIRRQIENRAGPLWRFKANAPDRYARMLRAVTHAFARFAADLERNYIFAWMDWDGDNVLASAGIIDYGSIRQFGLRHDQYRYDDVQRFSTNLNEQRGKARLMVQVFAQMTDFLISGKRKPLRHFSEHPCLLDFDRVFERRLREVFLRQVGLDTPRIERLLLRRPDLVERLYLCFSELERVKTKEKMKPIADGINRPAVFKMRAVLRELPGLLMTQVLNQGLPYKNEPPLTPEEMMTLMASSFARRRDTKLTPSLRKRILLFQSAYLDVMKFALGKAPSLEAVSSIARRAQTENQSGRITGNSVEFLIDEVLKSSRRGLSAEDIQHAVDLFISHQAPLDVARARGRWVRPLDLTSVSGRLFQNLMQIALEHEDDI